MPRFYKIIYNVLVDSEEIITFVARNMFNIKFSAK